MEKNNDKKDNTMALLLGLGIGAIFLSKLASAEEEPPVIPPVPPVPPSEDVKITDIEITKV